jgi:hypothetical protein
MLSALRKQRNADPLWKEACKWADTPAPDAPSRGAARRKPGESDEAFAERTTKRRERLTRREAYRKRLYDSHVADGASETSRVYWGTWNALTRSVDQARASVLKRRKDGLPAEWRRPRWDDPNSVCADAGGFRVVDRGGVRVTSKSGAAVGNPWWTIETRLREGWVRFRAKCGNWHVVPDAAELRALRLIRRKDGHGWTYSVSIAISRMPEERTYAVGYTATNPGRRELLDGQGLVALDWGHREHGHPNARLGMRVFAWRGSDGKTGEILLPVECRKLLDSIDETKSRMDTLFLQRKQTLGLHDRGRYGYRSRLMRSGVRSQEETLWLRWEMRYERRLTRMRNRISDLRRETYVQSVRTLRQSYRVFAIEDETTAGHRYTAKQDMTSHRKRSNREISARYLFTQICERFGAEVLPVPARNSTRECPVCNRVPSNPAILNENGPELEIACPSCGVIRDKDFGACEVILRRAEEALAERAAGA